MRSSNGGLRSSSGASGIMGFFPQDPITGTITAAADAKTLYEMVTDVARMGEWSPECRSCRWDDGAGPTVGSWFTGVNVLPESEQDRRHVLGSWWTGSLASPDAAWEGRCEVVVADPYAEILLRSLRPGSRPGSVELPLPDRRQRNGGQRDVEPDPPFSMAGTAH